MVKLYSVNCVTKKARYLNLLFVSVEFAVEQSLAIVIECCKES